MPTRAVVLTVMVVLLFSLPTVAAVAEETTPAPVTVAPVEVVPAPAIETAPSPAPPQAATASVVVPDTQIFKRTPVIDGVVNDGEWDRYYAYASADWQVSTYADWDSRNLYVAAKSNKPIDFLCVLDANDDGWFHGDENYEFKAVRGPDGNLCLTVSRYESRNTKSPVATPVSLGEAGMVDMKSSKSADAYMMEMCVPAALIRGFKTTVGKMIGFQVNVRTAPEETAWVPTSLLGDVRECRLVTKKFSQLNPLDLGFDVPDSRVARGEEISGKFHLTNTGTETLDARDFVIAGEGRAGDYLSSQKIRIEGLPPKKHVSHTVKTVIPTDMPVGSWALGAEVRSGDARLGAALVSFDVVDPFDVELFLPPNDVKSDVKDVTFRVAVTNNTRHTIRGKAKITLPVGWELWRNADTREFAVGSRESAPTVSFKAKPPLGEMGEVKVKVEVTVGRETKTVEGKFSVVNP